MADVFHGFPQALHAKARLTIDLFQIFFIHLRNIRYYILCDKDSDVNSGAEWSNSHFCILFSLLTSVSHYVLKFAHTTRESVLAAGSHNWKDQWPVTACSVLSETVLCLFLCGVTFQRIFCFFQALHDAWPPTYVASPQSKFPIRPTASKPYIARSDCSYVIEQCCSMALALTALPAFSQ
jgi:hypothetical protein